MVEGRAVRVDVEEVEPVVAGQLAKPAKLKGGSQIAGRLIFAEMAPGNPLVGLLLAGDHPEDRRLSGPVRADDAA